jgi:cation diffusion facilitator CzcD-associated flavoprotein CzcO
VLSEVVSKFLFSCGGYYNFDAGYTPRFNGVDAFGGTIIHPQQWPKDFDYSGKRVVVIGSGATAVTLVPAMAAKASQVIMLQRSPSYVVSRPECQDLANTLNKFLPKKIAYALNRWKNILLGMYFYSISKRKPDAIKKFIINGVKEAVGDDCDVAKHFTPDYNPWDQRVCSVTDGDLFEVIKSGSASIVTDHIERFTKTGILLRSGEEIEADIIVTATGLKLEMFSGMSLSKDKEVLDPSQSFVYKGMMLSEFPNFAYSVGYTNASWTLKSDLVGEYVCRLVKHMDKHKYDFCIPVVPAEGLKAEPIIDFQSGYVLRAAEEMAKQGSEKPWKLYQNYMLDRFSLGYQSVVDDSIDFRRI